jgi:hypothetical protein
MELCTGAGRARASVELAALLSHDGGPSRRMGFDVCCWHQTDLRLRSPHFCYWGISGPSSGTVRGPILTHFGRPLLCRHFALALGSGNLAPGHDTWPRPREKLEKQTRSRRTPTFLFSRPGGKVVGFWHCTRLVQRSTCGGASSSRFSAVRRPRGRLGRVRSNRKCRWSDSSMAEHQTDTHRT